MWLKCSDRRPRVLTPAHQAPFSLPIIEKSSRKGPLSLQGFVRFGLTDLAGYGSIEAVGKEVDVLDAGLVHDAALEWGQRATHHLRDWQHRRRLALRAENKKKS